MRSCTCPNCNANLEIDDKNRDFAFCQYCGAKIMLDDYRRTNTYRVVNEAKIKQAETEKAIRLKELELEEKKLEDKRKFFKIKLSLLIISILMLLIGMSIGEISGDPDSPFYMMGIIGGILLMGMACMWMISIKNNKK